MSWQNIVVYLVVDITKMAHHTLIIEVALMVDMGKTLLKNPKIITKFLV